MLQKSPSPLDALADLPSCKKLAAARDRLDSARQAEQAAAVAFRERCKPVADAGRYIHNDREASVAEASLIKATATARLAGNEVEARKRDHGETLLGHLRKHEAACLAILIEELTAAQVTARKISAAVEVAERDGCSPTYDLRKVRRIANELQAILLRFSSTPCLRPGQTGRPINVRP